MNYYSTRKNCPKVSLREALFNGLAPDGGLYMPEIIPQFTEQEIERMPNFSLPEIAFQIAQKLVGAEIPETDLQKIIEQAINFDAPIVELDTKTHVLELFHGPTLAFKDFGARFMAEVMKYFIGEDKVTILTATSGDTGSAVASGFHGKKNIQVIILFPKDKVSSLQEKQMTTLGNNITAIEIDGNFDDCQKLVKDSFSNAELVKKLGLSSANSINIGRLIPQTFYYFYSYSRLAKRDLPIVYSVPSGNFGNLTAGLIAKRMGLPIDQFIAATNINDVVPEYLETGQFTPRPSIETISNAMDIGNPSNFERIKDLYNNDLEAIQKDIYGASFIDEETKMKIKTTNYIIDPHGAIALLALDKFRAENGDFIGVALETAHPAKFIEVMEEVLERKLEIPEKLAICRQKEGHKITMQKEDFANYLKDL